MSTQDELLCTGCNFFGQLGIGYAYRSSPPYVPVQFGVTDTESLEPHEVQDIQCGTQFSVVLKVDGQLSICGTLNGSVFPSLTPIELHHPLKCIQVACGRKHIIALMDGGFVFSWGTGYLGQLGLGDDSSWDSPRMIRSLDRNKLGSPVVSIVCGGSHSGVMTKSGGIYMWGLNRNGQTGTSIKAESILEPRPVDTTDISRRVPKVLVCGRNHTCLLTVEGRVYSWGAGGFGRLGVLDSRKNQHTPNEIPHFMSRPARSIAAGDFHTIAIGVDGVVYSWGYGLEGQCGNGSTMNLRTPRKVEFPEGVDIDDVCCGPSWSFARTVNGELYTWGYGDGGWLGIEPADDVPYVESENPPVNHIYTKSFDSTVNVLRPSPVYLPHDRYIKWVRCGGGHAIFCLGMWDSSEGAYAHADEEMIGTTRLTTRKDEDMVGTTRLTSRKSGRSTDGATDRAEMKSSRESARESKISSARIVEDERKIQETDVLIPHSTDQFMSWVRHKKLSEIEQALANGFDVDMADANGNTPLIVACQNGHISVCKMLVERGARVSGCNKKGNTALHYCFAYGFAEIGEYLISCGANEYAVNSDGLTCYEGLSAAALEKI
mmetsp:Transcript_16577/g.24937  ORF Transcript_16577/g.24937 Transcript_16577/m.24937 type:complete len:602 (+) Transcript_16577:124-1929(+)|eukprot:CAMPEP_0185035036 /NCGR_PEP_ID=MMETSP1103-20130426/25707_1 /TAXON_ID=36769 /ORGANISM="Paraphysomonas bandaiensis, Strain Caron Lab Isolate" /LENGTH=601 /DNA_ID=CAMNT_0027571943 /DNA_START=29 /DNA_END=1834 /DNA_ORIENTATION=-